MGQVGTKLAVKFGKLRTKRRILYIHKLPIHRKAATMLKTVPETMKIEVGRGSERAW